MDDELEYVKVAETPLLPAGKMMLVVAKGKEILLANVEGTYYAISNKCTHMGGMLCDGKLEGSIVTCPRHGSQFDVKTGKAVRGPQIPLLNIKIKDEMQFTVKVEGTSILVGIPRVQSGL
jgi:3-phenylpropionate/trans-cinnamate dioxygenase ferredoxin subunit